MERGQYLGQNTNYKLQFWDKKKQREKFNITPQEENILIFRWTEAGLYADCSVSLVCRGKENKKCGFVARLCLWSVYLLPHIHIHWTQLKSVCWLTGLGVWWCCVGGDWGAGAIGGKEDNICCWIAMACMVICWAWNTLNHVYITTETALVYNLWSQKI